MKKELQTNIRTVKNTLARLLQRAEKINDVAERNLVHSHLKKAHDELSEAHEKLQSDASCRDCSVPVRGTDNQERQMPLRY